MSSDGNSFHEINFKIEVVGYISAPVIMIYSHVAGDFDTGKHKDN